MTREQRLALALQAAIRWPYLNEMWTHIRNPAEIEDRYAAEYRNDMATIADGVRAAEEIGIVALTASQVIRAQKG